MFQPIKLLCIFVLILAESINCRAADRPNIIVILADDVGYGDIGCYGATKVKTPNIDRLAVEGLRFTSGYAPSATCTPTRYAMLTGEYAWRQKGTGILPGDAAMIIAPGRTTLPSVLKQASYTTAAVGKWHLGLGDGKLDWNAEIKPGPLEIGFDYCFLLPATGDRVPCVYLENHRIVNLDPTDPIKVNYKAAIGDEPTGVKNPELLKVKPAFGHNNAIVNGISRIGYMTGGTKALWKDEDIADVITKKASEFIEKNKDKPFFLYYAAHDIHVPRAPHARYAGKSGCGIRGDVIEQLDGSVGEIMATLDRLKLRENTLVIFTSDNGPVVNDGYLDGAVENLNGHTPAGALRGGKYSLFEGGTRVPFIANWPGRIKPGVSNEMVSQIDFMASFAALTGQKLSDDAGPDTFNVLSALLGEMGAKGREYIIEHAGNLSIRKGNWKLIPKPGKPAGKRADAKEGEGAQLYNLADDIGESKSVAAKNPDVVKELEELLQQVRDKGKTRP
jgi:arylsulfatase A-like enzyme